MYISFSTMALKIPETRQGVVLVIKNFYLSCDPYMRNRMRNDQDPELTPFTPSSPITGFEVVRVAKVLDSTHTRASRKVTLCGEPQDGKNTIS
ncbi:hypothetical protein PTKIN_Ptkin17bG0008800 [Pterospermum kingtungense]